VGSKKQRKLKATAPSEYPVTAVFRRIGERHVRSIDAGAYHAEQTIRERYGAEAGRLLSALPPEDQMQVASDMVERIKDGRMKSDDAASWLLILVRQKQQALEQAASAAAGINAAQRSRGGKASSAARRDQWRPWKRWCDSHPNRAFRKFRRAVISAIQGRTDAELKLPANLPVIRGQKGKPPSERSIRQHLFGAK
jgi:hypothetical protein